jgi:diguanylate cyclase (GGDEF)-like protein
MADNRLNILVVDDDELDRVTVKRAFRHSRQSINIDEAADEASALTLLRNNIYDCILLDYRLGATDGLDLFEKIQTRECNQAPVIMLSGMEDEALMLKCLKAGVQDYLLKSEITTHNLIRAVRYAQERKQINEQLRFVAEHDVLTGLANRALFLSSIKMAMARAKRNGNYLAVMYIDLDHFKGINDSLGHDIGDALLKAVSDKLKFSVRGSDLVSRIGGDEFAVLLDGIEEQTAAVKVAQHILDVMSIPVNLTGDDIVVTPSIGVAIYPGSGNDVSALVQCADTAMYRAKKSGRNNFCFYSNEMHSLAMEYASLKNELGHAIKHNELELYYQPQFSARTGRITGLEALIRWNHPQRGMVSPVDFIPVAENCGLIVAIGDWVLGQACQQFSEWSNKGLFDEGAVVLSVNVSAHQLHQGDIATLVKNTLEKNAIEGHLLELELTESVLIDDLEQCANTLHTITRHGVRIALDDFGTGYASFRHLQKLPLHTLKIDRSFIDKVDVDKKHAEIVASIIAMGKALNLEIVAEGVETEPQEALLKAYGCDTLQGFYYSKPLPAKEIEALLSCKPN